MRQPVAYIRKSVVQKGARTISWEMQEADVRALAEKHGDTDLLVLSDWGKSGRADKTHKRAGYLELIELIESDKVSAVYAYSLSRLSRSTMEYARLAKLCEDHNVKVRLAKEGELEFTSPSGRLVVGMLALVAQMEAEIAQERARDVVRARRARGETIGRGKYGTTEGEDLQQIVDAYEIAGSLHGAARLLNLRGVPTRLGRPWRYTSVRAVLLHGAPELLPTHRAPGVAKSSGYLFARLLRCHCGSVLSPHSPRGKARYWCNASANLPDHPSPKGVAEETVIAWIRDEASRYTPPDQDVQVAEARTERMAEIAEALRRNRVMYGAGDLNDEEYLATKKALDTELEGLDAEGRTMRLGVPDWTGREPRLVNEWLRSFLDYVQLDQGMRPAFARWLLPEWRGETRSAG